MRISVAMATWNGEQFVGEQLESIAKQSRPPDELVISDDASSDRTIEIAEQFARRAALDVVILRNEERVGHGDNFFRAMTACTGDLIALCDQDDVWHPHKLARSERPFRLDRDVSLVAHSAQVVDEALRPMASNWGGRIRKAAVLPAGSLPPYSADRYAGFTMTLRSVFVRRVDVDNRPAPRGVLATEGVRIPHDLWANLVCCALGSVATLPDELALWRRHPSSITPHRLDATSRRIQHALALQDEEAVYRKRSIAARERGTYLERLRPLAQELGHSASAGLERTIESHRRYADAMDRRAAAYAESGARARVLRLTRHTVQGDYRPRSKGGLGLSSLARDVTIGLRGGARRTGHERH